MAPRLSRDDWADLGLRVLGEEGPEALTVAKLCGHAQRTRGSLYHHFDDHDALLHAVMQRWAERFTEAVIALAPDAGALNEHALQLDFTLEQAVRQLVARNPGLRPQLEAVDERRIAYLTDVHRRGGVTRPREVAEIEYAAFLGLQQLGLTERRLRALHRRFRSWLRG